MVCKRSRVWHPSNSLDLCLQSLAPVALLSAPNIDLLADRTSDNMRTLRLRISSHSLFESKQEVVTRWRL